MKLKPPTQVAVWNLANNRGLFNALCRIWRRIFLFKLTVQQVALLFLVLSLIFGHSLTALAAITFDNSSSGTGNSVASITVSHTVGTSSNRILVVGVSIRGTATSTSVAYGGTALTLIRRDVVGTAGTTELWRLLNPATGTANIVATFSASAIAVVGGVSFFGVDQSSPVDSEAGATGSSATVSATITTVATSTWLVDVVGVPANTTAAASTSLNQTERWDALAGTGGTRERGAGSTRPDLASAGATTTDWTLGASNSWSTGIIALKSATSPNATSTTNNTESGLTDGGRIGQSITINGTSFGSDPGAGNRSTATNNVKVGTYQIPDSDVTAWSDTAITFTVSSGINVLGSSSALLVRANDLDDSSPIAFFAYPDITSLTTPSVSNAARESESITLNGTRFDTATGTVTIAGSSATITSWGDTAVAVTVPTAIADDVATGSIVLTRNVDSKTDTFADFRILPNIQSLSPSSGPVGTQVTISGDHFCQPNCPGSGARNSATSSVTFNGTAVPDVDVTTWTATTVVAVVPTGATSGPVIVKSNSFNSSGSTFTVATPPDAASFTNNTDGTLTDGGRPSHSIIVTGTDFGSSCTASTTEIKIGTYEVPCGNVSSWASTSVTFTVPTGTGLPNGGASTSGLIVRRDSIDDNTPLTFFVYPRITSGTPIIGRQGDTITVSGDAFGASQGTSTVVINGTAGTIATFSDISVQVTINGGTATGNIVFTRGADNKTSNNYSFTILPRLTGVSPAIAPVASSITLTGDHFGTATGTVTLNGASSTISAWSSSSITAVVPFGATATGTVLVTRIDDNATSNTATFTVRATISSLSTSSARVSDSLTISGDHFSNTAGTVTINGASASISSWNDATISAIVPSSGTATGTVLITVNGSSSNAISFTILPTISNSTATTSRANSSLTISGDHFGTATGSITLNGATSTITSWSDTSIVITVPLAGTATGSIVASSSDNRLSNNYSFTILPSISTTSPSSGVPGDTVVISGDHFGSDPGSGNRATATDRITFNSTVATDSDVTAWADTSITVKVPTGATTGPLIVRRNNNDSNSATFTVNTIDATSFTNNTLALTDGGRLNDSITVTGTNFGSGPCDGSNNVVKIGSFSLPCASVSSWASTSISFTVASSTNVYGGTSSAGLIVRAGAVDDPSPLDFFIYPAIDSITVPSGFASSTAREFQSGDSDGIITLIGTRLGTTGIVTVLGITATTTSYADTSTTLQIPTGIADNATTGDILLTRTTPGDSKTATSTGFRILPRISSLSPNSGQASDTVTVNGNHFCQTGSCPGTGARNTATTSVTFNSTAVTDSDVTAWSATSITVKVPTGATTGPVIVKSNNFTSNGTTFSVGAPVPDATSYTNDTEGSLSDGARPNQNITVSGTNFGSACSATSTEVKIGTYEIPCASVSSWSSTSITLTVPTSTAAYGGTSTAGLIVRASDQDDATPLDFYIYPDVTSLSTTSAREGDDITLNGLRFGTAGTVAVLGESATVSWGDTSLTVTIPTSIADDATIGSIILTRTSPSGSKSDTATSGFRILPKITSLSPSSGATGTTVTISGNHFCQAGFCPGTGARSSATSSITFNNVTATDSDITTWTATTVVTAVPSSATTGSVIVKSNNFYSNGVTFTISTAATTTATTTTTTGGGGGQLPETITQEPVSQYVETPIPSTEEQLILIQKQLQQLSDQVALLEAQLKPAETPPIVAILPPLEQPEPIIVEPLPVAPQPLVIAPPQPTATPTVVLQPAPIIKPPAKPIVKLLDFKPVIEQLKKAAEVPKRITKGAGQTARRSFQQTDADLKQFVFELQNAGKAVNKIFEHQAGNAAKKISQTGNKIKKVVIGIPRLIVRLAPPTPIPQPQPTPQEQIVLRSGQLELVAEKNKPIQTIVGYRFVAEVKPTKPAAKVTDTFAFADPDGDNVWTAQVQMPPFTGNYNLVAQIDYKDGTQKSVQSPVLIDPLGYVYEQLPRGQLRIANAKITLFHFVNGNWLIWPADKYNQKNPQVTDETGQYSFLAPAGQYRLEVTAKDYALYVSELFSLDDNAPVNQVIKLEYLGN